MIKIFEYGHFAGGNKQEWQDQINLFLCGLSDSYKLHVTSTGSSGHYLTIVVEYTK